jgi:hypothetical protein
MMKREWTWHTDRIGILWIGVPTGSAFFGSAFQQVQTLDDICKAKWITLYYLRRYRDNVTKSLCLGDTLGKGTLRM